MIRPGHVERGRAAAVAVRPRRVPLLTFVVATCLSACHKDTDQPVESGRGFVTKVYADSQIETFSRSEHHLRGTIVERHDSIAYVALLGDSGLVKMVDLTVYGNGRGGASVQRVRFPMPRSTLPLLGGSGAMFEQVLRRVRAIGGDSVSVPVMHLGRTPTLDVMTISGNGDDSLIISSQTSDDRRNAIHIAIDSVWRITGAVLPLSGMRIRTQD
jgi:hypothetical protein